MSRHLFITVFFLISIFSGQSVFGYGGMATGVGTFTTGVGDSGTKRYRVALDETGQRLHGSVKGEIIEWITIDAPDTDIREILIRESKDNNGGISLLITAEDEFLEKFNQATLYVKSTYSTLKLVERVDGYWEQRNPVLIPLTQNNPDQKSQDHIVAFQLTSLGEKKLVEDASSFIEGENNYSGISAGNTSDRNMTSALWPWVMSGMLLTMAWFISHWMHALGWRGGR
ncbi:MAG: hypothetical protein L3J84_14165 [Gammaproteobacteria bacterium]|nr:hypothetical protein [Gammaproteobacteria bacterium]